MQSRASACEATILRACACRLPVQADAWCTGVNCACLEAKDKQQCLRVQPTTSSSLATQALDSRLDRGCHRMGTSTASRQQSGHGKHVVSGGIGLGKAWRQ